MARIPKTLSGPLQLTTTATTQYTVPSTTIGVLRQILVSNPGTTSANLTISIGADAAGTRIFDAYPVAATTILDRAVYIPMVAGTVIQAKASVATQIVLTLTGDELVLGY